MDGVEWIQGYQVSDYLVFKAIKWSTKWGQMIQKLLKICLLKQLRLHHQLSNYAIASSVWKQVYMYQNINEYFFSLLFVISKIYGSQAQKEAIMLHWINVFLNLSGYFIWVYLDLYIALDVVKGRAKKIDTYHHAIYLLKSALANIFSAIVDRLPHELSIHVNFAQIVSERSLFEILEVTEPTKIL